MHIYALSLVADNSPVAKAALNQIGDPGVVCSITVRPNTFVEIDHEIFSRIMLHLLRIQERLLSLTNESMCTEYMLKASSTLSMQCVIVIFPCYTHLACPGKKYGYVN